MIRRVEFLSDMIDDTLPAVSAEVVQHICKIVALNETQSGYRFGQDTMHSRVGLLVDVSVPLDRYHFNARFLLVRHTRLKHLPHCVSQRLHFWEKFNSLNLAINFYRLKTYCVA